MPAAAGEPGEARGFVPGRLSFSFTMVTALRGWFRDRAARFGLRASQMAGQRQPGTGS
jgi:hypothetical protein